MVGNQVKWGIILSYLLILLNTLFGFLVTPYMIGCLGEAEYGVYKTISSLTASLMVLDLGLGSTVTRYIATYKAKGEDTRISNFVAMSLLQAAILCVVVGIVAIPVYRSVDSAYARTFSLEQIQTAKILLLLMMGNMMIHIIENVINGVITGINNFLVGNGMKVLRLVFRIFLLLALLSRYHDSRVIVLVDIGVSVFALSAELFFVVVKQKIKIKLSQWDKMVFVESGKYTALMFLQNIAIQFNGNVDTILIGALISATSVTIYSMSLIIFGLYENLSSAISSVMLPSVVKLVEMQAKPEDLQKCVQKVGRLQFAVLGAALGGYIILGKDFYNLWMGKMYEDCYWLTLILIIPVTLPMLQNVALSILRAQNKMGYRTITLLFGSLINVVISIVGIRYIGYWGAAIGTAAYSISNLILMNIYYHQQLKFKILSLFSCIFSRTIICIALSMLVASIMHSFCNSGWGGFLVCAVVYSVVYILLMIVWGFNSEEKALLHIRTRSDQA